MQTVTTIGHTVRLMPPAYVRSYVKRQKNDAADAEAICEAVTRANMRFVGQCSANRPQEGDPACGARGCRPHRAHRDRHRCGLGCARYARRR
jgi:transposase